MAVDTYVANYNIRTKRVILIDQDGLNIGECDTKFAQGKAMELGLDLVQIGLDNQSNNPVCKIMDLGKFKYEQTVKDRKNRAASKVPEMKHVRLGRSIKIDPHDVKIRIDQSRKFLEDGHKVQIVQRLSGREMAHKNIGLKNLEEAMAQLSDVAKVEQSPRWVKNEASIILSPNKKQR